VNGPAFVRRIVDGLCFERRAYDRDDMLAYGTLGLIEATHSYRPDRGAKLTTWCYRRVRGAVLDGRRRARWFHRGPGYIATTRITAHNHPTVEPTAEAKADVARLLSHLPEREAVMLALVYLCGWRPAEVARLLGISRAGARRLQQRALERCRGMVQG